MSLKKSSKRVLDDRTLSVYLVYVDLHGHRLHVKVNGGVDTDRSEEIEEA